MPQGKPMPGEIYRHFKNKMYQIVTVAAHSETGEWYVVYQALYGDFRTYIRPYDMFISPVDHHKYPDVEQEYRFAMIEEPVVPAIIAQEKKTESVRKQDGMVEKTTETDENPNLEAGEELQGVNPHFLAFLDADSYSKKYDIVTDMEEELDDHLINQMAASIDEIIEDGRLGDRIMQLEACLRTKARYELNRAR
ncbi:MAG: DUF1653 domain-containing protein [Lachnospiraceae bacterium]|nr:DUF1653 domain-containing protein [Lachnospiraceae bacterium]